MMISGNRVSPEYLSEQPVRFVSYDGRIYEDIEEEEEFDYQVISWVSQNWNAVFQDRSTPFSEETCNEITRLAGLASKRGQKVRFWNVPETVDFWENSIRCGVDILNVDNYQALNEYLLS